MKGKDNFPFAFRNSRCFPLLAMAVIMILTLWVHVTLKSRQEYNRALDARREGLQEEAALHLERAILWYAPLNRYVFRAAEALWQLSEEAERTGETQRALRGYQALRSALYASRSIYVPGRKWISRCDRKIAQLMARQKTLLLSEAYKSEEQSRREYLALMQASIRPRDFWAVVAVVGFAGWMASSVAFILQGLLPAGGFQKHRALACGGFFLLFYAAWLVGMWKA